MASLREYIDLNKDAGYPAGSEIFYKCGICGDSVPSIPDHAIACKCRNIIVDVDAGRVAVKDAAKIKAFVRESLNS